MGTITDIGPVPVAVAATAGRAYTVNYNGNYVTMSDGKTITVINTATNAVIGWFITDKNPSGGNRTIAVSGNTLYVTDDGDNTM